MGKGDAHMSGHRVRAAYVVAAAALILLTACGSSGGSDTSDPDPTGAVVDVGCQEDWPRRLPTRAETVEEVEFLEYIVVCASPEGTSRLFLNNSAVVWRFVDDGLGKYTAYPNDDVSERFREAVASELGAYYTYMAPADQIVAEYATLDGAQSVSWYIDRKLSTALAFQTIFEDQVVDLAQDSAVRIFTSGSAARKAVGVCAVAGLNTGILVGSSEVGFNVDTLGVVAKDLSCANAWQAAELAPGETRFPTIRAAIGEAADVADRVTVWATISQYVQRGCQISPRFC